jgi:hypothetical protein
MFIPLLAFALDPIDRVSHATSNLDEVICLVNTLSHESSEFS